MNVNLFTTKDYENKQNWTISENKPNSNLVLSAACPERSRMGRMGQFLAPLFRVPYTLRGHAPKFGPLLLEKRKT